MPNAVSLGHEPPMAIQRREAGQSLRKTLHRPQFWFGVAVLVPTMMYYISFAFFPIVRGLWLAVVDYDFINRANKGFIGLDNFDKLFMNPLLVTAVQNTVLLAVMDFVATLPLALLISTFLVSLKRGMGVYQPAIFLPVVVSLVAVALLFRMLLDPDTGQVNGILNSLGLPTSKWLSDSSSALPTVAGIDVWKGLGFNVLLLTAGMLNIPGELHDAARVDGVNEWQRFWFVTLPLLGHTLALVMILMAIGALQAYTNAVVLTDGGPGNATFLYNILIVREAFGNMRFGVGAAAALLQFVAIFVISMTQLKLVRPTWSY